MNNPKQRQRKQLLLLFVIGIFLMAFTPYMLPPGLNNPTPIGKFLNGNLPSETPGDGSGNDVTWSVEPAFPNLRFDDPLVITPYPIDNRLLVASRGGYIETFDYNQNATTKQLFLDLTDKVGVVWDGGFLGFAFHPQFGQNGSPNRNYVYVFYTAKGPNGEHGPFSCSSTCFSCANNGNFFGSYLRVSRFTVNEGTYTANPNSEFVMINIRQFNGTHRGGGLHFGNDGFLYLAIGDQARRTTAQNIVDNFEGGVIRIDVDRRGGSISHAPRRKMGVHEGFSDEYTGVGYYIPNSNPWQDSNNGLFEEFVSLGHRNPHRMTKDRGTGQFWIGEVGAGSREEVSVLQIGGNCGWPVYEGNRFRQFNACGSNTMDLGPGTYNAPVVDFLRSEANAIIGGYVYRGSKHPSLVGKYICGGYAQNRLFLIESAGGGNYSKNEFANFSPGGLITFGEGPDAELFMGRQANNTTLYQLRREGGNDPAPQFLSQTGAFANLSTLQPASGVIPYDMIEPFWSDGANKKRWLAIPNDGSHNTSAEQIQFSANGNWSFPRGAVLIKHFELGGKRLETRFEVKGDNDVFYYLTYKWNSAGTDAELLTGGLDEVVTVNGQSQIWRYPSTSECLTCHQQAAGSVLGLKTRYLNKSITYPSTGTNANQLVTLSHLGILDQSITDGDVNNYLTVAAKGDASASLELRARSYLDVNCSYCHQPGTGNRAQFDARITTPLDQQNLLYGPIISQLNLNDPRAIYPMNVGRSMVHYRMNSLASGVTMPPLAKNKIDAAGVQLIEDWINSIDETVDPCEASSVTYLSDLNWVGTPTNGWGPAEKDQSNGETEAGDGNTMTINGQTYSKGLGVHAYSQVTYNLGGNYDNFYSDIGLDDECAGGTVSFQIYVDGTLAFSSGVMVQSDDAQPVIVDVSGANELILEVTNGGDGNGCDHANWAGARLESCDGSGGLNGLVGNYYDNINFTNSKLERIDPIIDFNWGSGSPDPSIGNNTFSVIWEGEIETPTTGTYTFFTRTDDGVKLWIDDQLVIDKFIDQPPTEWSGTQTMTAGERKSIKIEYYENGGGAVAELRWNGPGFNKQIIPTEYLFPVINNSVNTPPEANFVADPMTGNFPLIVNFDASSSSDVDGDQLTYNWSFGDGNSGTGVTTSHTFNNPGTYNVVLTVSDGSDTDLFSLNIIVTEPNRAPVAAFTATPTSGDAPLAVSFDASSSSDLDGDALTYSWDFGDGNSGTGVNASNTYAAPGTYTATLTVSDGSLSNTATETITVTQANRAPVAAFTATPTSGDAPLAVSFDASSSSDLDGDALTYSWDFGDGNSGTGVNASNTYAAPGTYTATLTVSDGSLSNTATETITVTQANRAPVAAFIATPTSGDAPLAVSFDASSSSDLDGDALTYSWDFGDGNSGTGVNASNTYTALGTYTATLTVSDGSLSNTATETITVTQANRAPVAAFTATPTSGDAPLAVSFDASSSSDLDGDALTYSWDFGDGNSGTGVNASNTYAAPGTYTATLTVSDGSLSNTATETITVTQVNRAPVAAFTATPTSGDAPLAVSFDASSSSDLDEDPLTYSWNFGDGNIGTGVNASNTYTSAGTFTVVLTVSDGQLSSTTTADIVVAEPTGSCDNVSIIYLSDISWEGTPTNGRGPIEKDQSVGNYGVNDGTPISINGQIYSKGLGAHAYSSVTYNLQGYYKTFIADLGVDDATCTAGSVKFMVYVDGNQVYESPLIRQGQAPLPIQVNVEEAQSLRLEITDGGLYGITCDHADWAGARLERCDQANNTPPTASFTATPNSGEAPLTVDFDGSSSSDAEGGIVSYDWDFGDGSSDSGIAVSHEFTDPGTYTVTLTVSDSELTGTTTQTITVTQPNLPPVASFTTSPTSGEAPLDVSFNASNSSDPNGDNLNYFWDFGDGNSGIGVSVTHQYTSQGTYTVTLTVSDGLLDGTSTEEITVYEPGGDPCPNTTLIYLSDLTWEGTPTNGRGPVEKDQSVGNYGLNDGSTLSINGNTYSKGLGAHAYSSISYNLQGYYRTFFAEVGVDDGTCTSGSVRFLVYVDNVKAYESPLVRYGQAAIPIGINVEGAQSLRLEVTDGGVSGATCDHADWADAKLERCDQVNNTPPTASFTATPLSGQAPLTVSFDGTGSSDAEGGIVSYSWDFGDGTTGSGANISHTFSQEGTYIVTLTVSDSELTGSTTETITVSEPNTPPVASFTATPMSGEAPLTVSFEATGSFDPNGDPLTYAWDFGDGNFDSGLTAENIYVDPGTYTVILTVNDGQLSSTSSIDVDIFEPGGDPCPNPAVLYLSDLSWEGTPVNGRGPIELDQSVGNYGVGDGSPITINGQVFTKGLGVHAISSVTYNLQAKFRTFYASIGVDDATCSAGSVVFEVYLDNIKVYESPVVRQGRTAIPIEVDVEGGQELRLEVQDGGLYGITCDHANWADARLERCDGVTSTFFRSNSKSVEVIDQMPEFQSDITLRQNQQQEQQQNNTESSYDFDAGFEVRFSNKVKPSIWVYPNPVTNYEDLMVEIKGPSQDQKHLEIKLFDINGKQVFQQKADFSGGASKLPIGTTDLPQGMYILQVSGENWVLNKQVIVQY